MERVIVTGATSMLGVSLIEECVKNETPIIAVVCPTTNKINRLPDSHLLEVVYCDLKDYKDLPRLIEGKGGVFYHFAWKASGWQRDVNACQQTENIGFTINAIDAASLIGCKLFIGAGSQAEYGKVNNEKIGPHTPVNPETPYGVSKYAAGKIAMLECSKLGMQCIWARIFSIYGKYDNNSTMIQSTILKILNEEKTFFTQGIHLWDYLYSQDAGRAFFLLGQKGKDQTVYCIGSGKTRPLYEFISIIASLTNPKLDLGIGMIPYTQDNFKNLCADISNLTKDTGFVPLFSFEEGIKKTIEFIKNGIY